MSPALKALAAHQKTIEAQNKRIAALTEGLRLVASLAGVEGHPKMASLLKQADVDNPAQPVPQPGGESAPEDTEEVLGDVQRDQPSGGGQTDDLFQPGNTSETRTAPDAGTDVTSIDTVLDPGDGIMENQDVTQPVSGTEERRPLDEVKIETDVRVDDGVKTDVAFPMENDFQQQRKTTDAAQHTAAGKEDLPESFKKNIKDGDDSGDDDDDSGKKSESRMFASLRLARLRIQAGIAEEADDISLSTKIAHGDASDEAIQHEINTLAQVTQASQRRQPKRPRHLVPQQAQAQGGGGGGDRSMPSLQPEMASTAGSGSDDDDPAIFE